MRTEPTGSATIPATGPVHRSYEDDPIYESVRLRFETQCIAPVDLPHFRYVASALTHSAVHYTALIHDTTLMGAVARVKEQWLDAIIHVAEVSDGEFNEGDKTLHPPVYGVASQSANSRPGLFTRIGEAFRGRAPRNRFELPTIHT